MQLSTLVPPRSQWASGGGLAAARIGMGLLWLTNLSWKWPPSFGCTADGSGGLCFWMQKMADNSRLSLHARFVRDVALPHYKLFGYLTISIELLAGVLLLLGLFTRLGALLGLVQSINLFIGLSLAPGEWVWSYATMILLHLVLLGFAAGRWFGVDAVLRAPLQHMRGGGRFGWFSRVPAALT